MSHTIIIRMYDLAGVREGGVVRCHSWIILQQPGWSSLTIPGNWRVRTSQVPMLDSFATPWLELPYYSWRLERVEYSGATVG